jgi:hypothetical protein
MTAVIHQGSGCALTASSMSHMTFLTITFFANWSQILVLLGNLQVPGKTIYCSWVSNQLDVESGTFGWPVRPLHTHSRVIMSYNLVTEIKK